MSTPAISADAAGITDGAKKRTGSVVETLIAPHVAASAEYVDLPVKLIDPHPRNPKGRDSDIDDLVASVASDGVIYPLIVTPASVWNEQKPDDLKEIHPAHYVITGGGHRRRKAALQVGLETVPCIIRTDFAGAKGRRAALLENLHRHDLDAFDEAEAFAELTGPAYKLSQRDLAAMVGCTQPHISKRLKLLKLPTTFREAVRIGKHTIGDALELAGVVDSAPVFDKALRMVNQNYQAKRAVQMAQQEHDAHVRREKTIAELAATGARTIDRRPSWYGGNKNEPATLDELKIADKHTDEPCHVFYIDTHDGAAVPVCEKPARHLKGGDSKVKFPRGVADRFTRAGSSSNDARQAKESRELKKAIGPRVEFVRSVLPQLGGNRVLKARAAFGHVFHRTGSANDVAKIVLQLLNIENPKGTYPATQVQELAAGKRSGGIAVVDEQLLEVIVAIAYFELRVRPAPWRSWAADEQYYLDQLQELGYAVSPVEADKLAKIKAPKTAPAAACDICGDVEGKLPPGVTWVSPTRCSGCSDAEEAGWVEPTTEVVA